MGVLNKDAILAADDLKTETVPVPEWGGEVALRTLPGTLRDEWDEAISARRGKDGKIGDSRGLKVLFLSLAIVDANGKPMFSQADVAVLNRKHSGVIDRLFVKAQELNALSADAVEIIAGNSASGQSADSGSSSPKS